MSIRRKQLTVTGKTEVSTSTPSAPHHPGYAPNAAFHAIKRHALEFVNPKELMVSKITYKFTQVTMNYDNANSCKLVVISVKRKRHKTLLNHGVTNALKLLREIARYINVKDNAFNDINCVNISENPL